MKRLEAAVPDDLFAALHAEAARRDRTVSETAADLLYKALGLVPAAPSLSTPPPASA